MKDRTPDLQGNTIKRGALRHTVYNTVKIMFWFSFAASKQWMQQACSLSSGCCVWLNFLKCCHTHEALAICTEAVNFMSLGSYFLLSACRFFRLSFSMPFLSKNLLLTFPLFDAIAKFADFLDDPKDMVVVAVVDAKDNVTVEEFDIESCAGGKWSTHVSSWALLFGTEELDCPQSWLSMHSRQ